MKKLLSILALITISSFSAFAELSVKEPCSNGMVLQQNSSPVVWGHASPGAKVRVTTSWDSATYSATTNQKGVWKINVVTPVASYSAYSITVKGEGTSIKIEDVLIGEVWIAAGQSNMEMPMKDSYGTEHEWETEQRMKSPWAPYTSYNGLQDAVLHRRDSALRLKGRRIQRSLPSPEESPGRSNETHRQLRNRMHQRPCI